MNRSHDWNRAPACMVCEERRSVQAPRSMRNDKFSNIDQLETFLKSRGVDESDAKAAALLLFPEFDEPDALLNICSDNLKADGLSTSLAMKLSNKLSKRQRGRQQQQQQHELLEKFDVLMDYVLKEKEKSEAIALSKPTSENYEAAMSRIGVMEVAASWNDKPAPLTNVPGRHQWLPSQEDSVDNRDVYMAYLADASNLEMSPGMIIFHGTEDSDLLSVDIQGFDVKISGSIAVPIAEKRHQSIETVGQNMLGAFELKKDRNWNPSISKQVTLQHIAAS